MTAEAASHVPCVGGQTIAGHCAHLAYYVRVNHNYAMGREQHVDWASSWRPQQVGEAEWEELKGRVRGEYAALIETLESLQTWEEQQVGDSMAIVAHTAYHLGAIRTHSRIFERSVSRARFDAEGVDAAPLALAAATAQARARSASTLSNLSQIVHRPVRLFVIEGITAQASIPR